MRRHPVILLLCALALTVAACGDDAATTIPGESSTTTAPRVEAAAEVWYTDWDTGVVARWDLAAESCRGTTAVGISADLIEVGLGWVWATDCRGGQLVRLDIQTGEVTGRIPVGGCPTDLAISFGLVWLAVPQAGRIIAVHPETGRIVAEGTSDLEDPIYLAAGSLHAAGPTYYWRIDEVAVDAGGGNDVWTFKVEEAAAAQGQFDGRIQGLAVSGAGGNDIAILGGPPQPDEPTSDYYSDPNYPTGLFLVGADGTFSAMGDPLQGFYHYLGGFDGHWVTTSKMTGHAVVLNGGVQPVPVGAPPGPPVGGPPPPGNGDGNDATTTTTEGGAGGGPGVWIGGRDPQQPVLFFFPVGDPPASLDEPTVELGCQRDGATVGLGYYAIVAASDITAQVALAAGMDRSLFPIGPMPEEPVTPTVPTGPRFSSCSVGYESSGRLLNDLEGKTEAGATVVLSIEYGTQLYADIATVTAGDDGSFAFPEMSVDDLGPPAPPPDAVITVVFTADEFYEGACRLEVET